MHQNASLPNQHGSEELDFVSWCMLLSVLLLACTLQDTGPPKLPHASEAPEDRGHVPSAFSLECPLSAEQGVRQTGVPQLFD